VLVRVAGGKVDAAVGHGPGNGALAGTLAADDRRQLHGALAMITELGDECLVDAISAQQLRALAVARHG